MDSNTFVRQEATPDGRVLCQWECRTCGQYGPWTDDKAATDAQRAEHVCPGMTKAAPPRP